MPHRTKKKFIDKKKAVTFQLVHRSQKDPLAADDEAPQHVLVPLHGEITENELMQQSPLEREMRLSKQKMYGVGFDDDYDYMQHLREPEKQTAILVPKNRVTFQEPDEEHQEMTEVLKDGGHSASIKIPSVVFASKDEEEVGMLHRAIPPVGPQVEWDPDIVAAMDEDFNFEDPENIIEDDFILKATGEDDDEYEGSDQDTMEEDFSGSDIGSWTNESDQFEKEETKSRFTQYSMTSSILPRTEHLNLLDDQFEKFYETYDDEKIGDLGQVEIDGAVPVDNVAQEDAIMMLLGIKDENVYNSKEKTVRTVNTEYAYECDSDESTDEDDEDNHLVELTKEVPKEKWDCESILSTYSNIYNHPKLIKEPPKPIKLSRKTGVPLDTLPTRGLTAKQLRALDLENEALEEKHRVQTFSESSLVSSNVRKKNESREERNARKQAVKEMRRERRAEKKATKVAFQQEKTRQHKEQLNLQKNLSGIRIS